ncbi:MAG: hypothetical protein K6F91_02610 [Ruminococcus sp.]|nr:hypothetical protein [Ruminococcus sp.]
MKKLKTKAAAVLLAMLCISFCGCSMGEDIAVSQTQVDVSSSEGSATVSSTTTAAPETTTTAKKTKKTSKKSKGKLSSTEDIKLTETEEGSFTFIYSGETFNAYYTTDNWKIIDSYKITEKSDIIIICTALSEIHPIHNKDYTGYREPDDLAYEWEQHNTAYKLLPDSSPWKKNTKDVDLDPKDQGKSFMEMARDRLR